MTELNLLANVFVEMKNGAPIRLSKYFPGDGLIIFDLNCEQNMFGKASHLQRQAYEYEQQVRGGETGQEDVDGRTLHVGVAEHRYLQ